MKTIIAVIMVLFVATAVFAGDTNVKFNSPTMVNGQKLAAGDYVIRYDIKGTTADVKIIQNQKAVITTTATVVENKDKAPYTGVVRVNNADGTASLKEIQMADKTQVIRFEMAPAVGK